MFADIARLFLPGVAGYAMASQCNPGSVAMRKETDPPPIVFSIVWPILYLLIGLAWLNAARTTLTDSLFLSLTLVLALWIYMYGCAHNRSGATYVLLVSLALSFAAQNCSGTLLLAPLCAWLIYALMLSRDDETIKGREV